MGSGLNALTNTALYALVSTVGAVSSNLNLVSEFLDLSWMLPARAERSSTQGSTRVRGGFSVASRNLTPAIHFSPFPPRRSLSQQAMWAVDDPTHAAYNPARIHPVAAGVAALDPANYADRIAGEMSAMFQAASKPKAQEARPSCAQLCQKCFGTIEAASCARSPLYV